MDSVSQTGGEQLTRRNWLMAALSSVAGIAVAGRFVPALAHQFDLPSFQKRIRQIEESSNGGRLGVALLDTSKGDIVGNIIARVVGYNTDQQFPMCSTFKLLLVGAVLKRVDHRDEKLDRIIYFTQKELVPYSPVTEKRIGDRGISVEELCAAAITLSDNTAANLLLASIGGPSAVTAFARTLGDNVTRLDRIEPDLNEARPDDPRDTSTPSAMLRNLHILAIGEWLSTSSRAKLTQWLIDNKTGDKRLRAGLPAGWRVGDKTGSGQMGTTNDLAIIWPPGRAPLLVSVYLTQSKLEDDERNNIIAAVGKVVADMVQH